MIITRSPLRVSLGGGGTDLPSYYSAHEGFLIAGAIDKYVYITLHHAFTNEIILKYSRMEKVSSIDQIEHSIIREALRLLEIKSGGIELTSMADVPVGTGMGSSGSFTCALLKALHTYNKNGIRPEELAEQACKVEMEMVKAPVGKQDQYVAAFGGINTYTFHKDGKVDVKPLRMSEETLYSLEDNLLLFFTGFTRSAMDILKHQDSKSKEGDHQVVDNLSFIKDLAFKSKKAMENGDLNAFAEGMNIHWEHKKQISGKMSNPDIDRWYELALKNGALGGKLLGAGGGGFLMFYAEDSVKLRKAMAREGLKEVHFRFDFGGTSLIAQS